MLSAEGVSNPHGPIQWPIGLEVLPGKEADRLRRQIEALVQNAGSEGEGDKSNSDTATELSRAVGDLRRLLRRDEEERRGLSWAMYREGARFLTRLDKAAHLSDAGRSSPGATSRENSR
jgi:hypothetical protein